MAIADDQAAAAGFLQALLEATRRVADPWFVLPYAGDDLAPRSIYRERVYCYELYHQLRRLDERNEDRCTFTYVLSGEIAKSGQNAVIEGAWRTPDFVWHIPGSMRNAVVMEVKSASNLGSSELKKDLRTLGEFVTTPGPSYASGILLVFGPIDPKDLVPRVLDAAVAADLSNQSRARIRLVLQQEIRSDLLRRCGFVREQQAATVESQRLCGPQKMRRWLPPTE